MSAIAFSTKVDKETDTSGNDWVVITMRGKWSVFPMFVSWIRAIVRR